MKSQEVLKTMCVTSKSLNGEMTLLPEMHLITNAYSILINMTKCLAKSERKPPHCNLTVNICVQVRICNRIVVYVSWRKRVKRTQFYELYCLYFLPEVMVKSLRKARGHLVMLI